MKFIPKNLSRWTQPDCYVGPSWPAYYSSGCGQTRDSGALEKSNFTCMLNALGGESDTVRVICENHWAVGWIEWIAIHESDTVALQTADKIQDALSDYPIINENHFSEVEWNDAQEVWSNCYDTSERIAYIRDNRGQFEFRNLSDLIGCVRGHYFAGYASELLA